MSNIISKKFNISLDINGYTTITRSDLYCRRYDDILFSISLMDNNRKLDISNCNFSLVSVNSKKEVTRYNIENFKIENGNLVFAPSPTFTKKADTILNELVISYGESKIKTQVFKFVVNENLKFNCSDKDDGIIDEDRLKQIEKILDEYNETLGRFEDKFDRLNIEIDNVKEEVTKINSNISMNVIDINARIEKVEDDLESLKGSVIMIDYSRSIETEIEVKL